jgi:cytochrome c553
MTMTKIGFLLLTTQLCIVTFPASAADEQAPAADAAQQAAPAAPAGPFNTPEACVACHGPDGNSQAGTFPILAGQTSRYLYFQLRDFKSGARKDPIMSPIAQQLSKEDMQKLAQYFSEKKAKPIAFKADNARAAAGRKVSDLALCPMCHLGGFSGQNEIPKVAGQYPEYVIKQLKDFRAKNRTNDAGNMTAYAGNLTDEEIENLAHYIATLD